ncbi:MAG TPA: sodium/solute symporter [Longimicrobiales bacterium]|nr:sodium/solute symporter [Longimicrobiales bacterium]
MPDMRIAIFAFYFGIILLLGFYGLKKTRDEDDYWIAGGRLGWVVGGATLAATHTSGGTFIGAIGAIYTFGWSFGWVLVAIPLSYWFMAAVLAPRFTRVRELTVPAFIERRYYSKTARAVAGAIIMVAIVVYVQAQIVAGGLVANIVFGFSIREGMVWFTLAMLAYTIVGGMIAVVYTDFVQMLVMVVGTAFALPLALRHVDGVGPLMEYVVAAKPLAFSFGVLPGVLLFTMGLSFFLGSVATPEKLIRLYAMKDMRTIRRGILLTMILVVGLNLMVMTMGLVSIALFPALPTGDLAMPVVARAVLPPFIGTLLLAAVASAMMSTVDSLLIVAGSALSEDLYQGLVGRPASRGRRLMLGRVGILIVGTAPLLLVLTGIGAGELVQLIVLLFTALMASSFFIPVMAGVYWRRATREGAIAAMLGGVTCSALWKLLGSDVVDPVVAGFTTSAVLMVLVSLLTPAPPASALAPYFPEVAGGSGE